MAFRILGEIMLFKINRNAGNGVAGGTPQADKPTQDPKVENTENATGTPAKDAGGEKGGKTYTAAEHQAELDRVIAERLARADEKAKKERERAERDAEAIRLQESQQFQQLSEKRQARILELEPMVETLTTERDTFSQQVKALERQLSGYRDLLLESVPDPTRELVLKMPLAEQMEWLNANASKFSPANTPPKFPHTPSPTNTTVANPQRVNMPYYKARL